MATKNKFTTVELDWAENQLKTWMAFVEANPFDKLKDRERLRPTKNGGTVFETVATIEAQQKSIRDIMKDYLALLEVVERLRKAEEAKQLGTRGGVVVPDRMKDE